MVYVSNSPLKSPVFPTNKEIMTFYFTNTPSFSSHNISYSITSQIPVFINVGRSTHTQKSSQATGDEEFSSGAVLVLCISHIDQKSTSSLKSFTEKNQSFAHSSSSSYYRPGISS